MIGNAHAESQAGRNGEHHKWSEVKECPICNHKGWCTIRDDGNKVHCRREPAGASETRTDRGGGLYYVHWPNGEPEGPGATVEAERPAEPPKLAGPEVRDEVYASLLRILNLGAAHLSSLTRRGLTPDEIARRGYKTLPPGKQPSTAATLYHKFGKDALLSVPGFVVNDKGRLSIASGEGLLVPVRDPQGRIGGMMVRPDKRRDDVGKYVWLSSAKRGGPGPGALPHVPLAITLPAEVCRLTEGALKSDLATVISGLPTVGAPGVANWKPCLPVLKSLGCKRVLLAFDADAREKPNVGRALGACLEALKADGFDVLLERWDPARGNGIDDALLAGADIEILAGEAMEAAIADIVPPAVAGTIGTGDARPRAEGEPIRGANFDARIVAEIIRHECGTSRRQYEIRATRDQGKVAETVVIDAVEFKGMEWVPEKLGAYWLIESGRGDESAVRETIQVLSIEAGIARRDVHTSLGWVEHEGRWCYLHAGGAIGADGPVGGIGVDLAAALGRYRLPEPPTDPETLGDCVAACLGLLDLAKAGRDGAGGVAVTLATLPCRAALGPIDGAVHYSGTTATRKSTAARLAFQHFAIGINVDDPLTAAWDSTAGSLQRYAYDCHCSLLVVDELTGDAAVAVATQFFQNQANLKGRDRMDRQFRLAPSLDPRCGVLSTGEAEPTRKSALGRLLTVRFTHDTIDLAVLTRCQEDAAAGKYAMAMAAFLRYLAQGDRLPRARADLETMVRAMTSRVRKETAGKEVHARHPGLIAELSAAYRIFLRFAVESGCIGEATRAAYAAQVDALLIALATDQADAQAEADPARKFLALLASGLNAGKYHLKVVGSDNAPKSYAGACGWSKDWLYEGGEGGGRQYLDWQVPANSRAIGFIDEDAKLLYIDPEMAKVVARTMGRDQGQEFENVAKLGRELAEAKLILTAVEDKKTRYTIHKRIPNAGKQRYFTIPVHHVFGDPE